MRRSGNPPAEQQCIRRAFHWWLMPTMPPRHRPPGTLPPLPREQAEARRKALYNQQRPTPKEQGYDADWRKLSRVFRQRHPTCWTPGCGHPSEQVDHILSIRDRPDLRLVWSNLRALCRSCHSRRTALDQGFARQGI